MSLLDAIRTMVSSTVPIACPIAWGKSGGWGYDRDRCRSGGFNRTPSTSHKSSNIYIRCLPDCLFACCVLTPRCPATKVLPIQLGRCAGRGPDGVGVCKGVAADFGGGNSFYMVPGQTRRVHPTIIPRPAAPARGEAAYRREPALWSEEQTQKLLRRAGRQTFVQADRF